MSKGEGQENGSLLLLLFLVAALRIIVRLLLAMSAAIWPVDSLGSIKFIMHHFRMDL